MSADQRLSAEAFRRRQLADRIRRAIKANAVQRELRSYPADREPYGFDLSAQTHYDADRNPALFYGDAAVDARPYDPDAVTEHGEIVDHYRILHDTEG